MMKMIRPIVNISKVVDDFDTIVVGLRGVITDGNTIKTEAFNALVNMKKLGKKIILLTNSPLRVAEIANFFIYQEFPIALFDSIVSSGEIMHYKLKAKSKEYGAIGNKYYPVGRFNGAFHGLSDYEAVSSIPQTDFLFVNSVLNPEDTINTYLPLLEHAASMNIPFVCVGNEKSTYLNGEISLAPAALAEQYALLGGKIISLGKPDPKIISYALDDFAGVEKEKVLVIGDNITTDIKGASLLDLSSVLISKGVHVNYLGEGYIPDIAKTRELSNNFEVTPDFVISNLRW